MTDEKVLEMATEVVESTGTEVVEVVSSGSGVKNTVIGGVIAGAVILGVQKVIIPGIKKLKNRKKANDEIVKDSEEVVEVTDFEVEDEK